tara:strand:- start:5911 stop:6138 length:228 start_codon:yes stop_codon:yes gene_type:complete
MALQAVVFQENTLGLLHVGDLGSERIEVLNGRVSKGGRVATDAPIGFVRKHEYRAATLKDFDEYGVLYNDSYLIA